MKFGVRVRVDVGNLKKRPMHYKHNVTSPSWDIEHRPARHESTIIPLAHSSRRDRVLSNSLYISSYSNEPLDTASHLVTVAVHVIIMIDISIATVAKDSLR